MNGIHLGYLFSYNAMNKKIKNLAEISGWEKIKCHLPRITSRLPDIWNVTETPAFTWKNTIYSWGCGAWECVGQ